MSVKGATDCERGRRPPYPAAVDVAEATLPAPEQRGCLAKEQLLERALPQCLESARRHSTADRTASATSARGVSDAS